MSHPDVSSSLNEQLERVAIKRKARAIAVAIHDLETDFRFSLSGDRWFHAASTIKVAVLLAVFRAADESLLRLDDSLHVRNRFFSAGDGSIFHVTPDRDAMPELYHSIGRTARISSLAHAMISGSSNLATNLLLDFLSNESKQEVIRILLEQRFNSMIPARLPPHAAVAHKTGEISTACHDIGIVYLPEREPYIAVILTEFDADRNGRRETVAAISELIYRCLSGDVSKANEN